MIAKVDHTFELDPSQDLNKPICCPVLIGISKQLSKMEYNAIRNDQHGLANESVKTKLDMGAHFPYVVHVCLANLRGLWSVRKYMSSAATTTLFQAMNTCMM